MSVGGEAPPKFESVDGVRRISPAWKAWKAAQDAGSAPVVPQMTNAATALPIVTSVADQQRHLQGAQASASVQAAHEMLQDEDIAASIGANPQNVIEQLGVIFAKYEVPMGLINKLMGVSDFQFMEFIIDDSGSCNSQTDCKFPNGQPMTRWQEIHQRLTAMWEVLSYVPCPPAYIRFLNRADVIEVKRGDGEAPQAFYQRIMSMLAPVFSRPPSGTTPALERIRESLARCQGQSMIRYFFGDGCPNGGKVSEQAITQLLINRPNPAQNPFTFMSASDCDEDVEWMKQCEDASPFVSEFDDYRDEAAEVLSEQGQAFGYSYGMYLIGMICAAFNPNDLDALDESCPMTKTTLDNLMGYQCSPQEYQYYFDSFIAAQTKKPIESPLDKLKKDYLPYWRQNFQNFVTAPMANQIEAVRAYHAAVSQLKARGL